MEITNIHSYITVLEELKTKIRQARHKAALSVNQEMILLYWDMGTTILKHQKEQGWGTKVIDQLAGDLSKSFPEMKGLSPRNLKYMRAFADAYRDRQIVQQLVAQIPWGHNVRILDFIKNHQERLWYIKETIQNGWSRNVLVHQIESDLYKRQALVKKTTNFDLTLWKPQSELAKETLKDPYVFDFLAFGEEVREKDIEKQLLKHITKFLLELGAGFAFIGNQYHIEIEGTDYYIDLLFYHLKLRCFVAIELKTGEFKPEYAGKINFYLSAIDDLLKSPQDNPSIGMILCKTKNRLTVEYALRDMSKPIGVAEYKLVRAIPKKLKASLPSVEELEAEFEEDLRELKE